MEYLFYYIPPEPNKISVLSVKLNVLLKFEISDALRNESIIKMLITRLIVIGVAPLTVCFIIARSLICNCPLLKDISLNTKCLLVWCD